MKLNLTNDMCGIDRKVPRCALSELEDLMVTFTQGVALGWFVIAPSGRGLTRLQSRLFSVLSALSALLFTSGFALFAADSRLADAAEKSDRATIRPLLK